MEQRQLFENIDQREAYSPEYRQKLKQADCFFRSHGFELREHALNRFLGQRKGKDKFGFTEEQLLSILKRRANYRQEDGKYIRFYEGISVVSAEDTGEIVSIVVRSTPRKDWKAR